MNNKTRTELLDELAALERRLGRLVERCNQKLPPQPREGSIFRDLQAVAYHLGAAKEKIEEVAHA